ncbi:LLM class flavin-dependent oxidoreductase [Actinoplanes sp. NPDC049118]|uniref:LLM class flavin-dependent oxidoreductase n=1 Tax=Actinoplanes sp. NPDC049118 TaxID=3155769 RepID=UPI0033F7A8B1
MPRIGVMFDRDHAPEELPAYAVAAEGIGVDDLWLVEDLGWAGSVSSAALALAATSRIRVCIGIAPVPLRNPALLAMELATLARVYPGRVVAGLGHGVTDWMRQVGEERKSKLALLEESIVAVRGMLLGETVTLDGREVHLDGVGLVHPPSVVPPIVTGVVRPRSLELSGRVADGTILAEGNGPEQIAAALGHIRRGGAGAAHELITFVYLHVNDDPANAAEVTGELVAAQAQWLGIPQGELFTLIGPARDIPAGIQALTDAGAGTIVLRPLGPDPIGQTRIARAALGGSVTPAEPPSMTDSRARIREALVDAARELTVMRGWEDVRMADVAKAAGVSRQTLYNEFDGRAGLAEALAVREIRVFVSGVHRHLAAHGAEARAAAHAAILFALEEADRNPLVRAILTSGRGGADELLPYLTTRADIVFDAAGDVIREWAAEHLPGVAPGTVDVAADVVVRLTVSHIVLPTGPRADAADVLAGVFVRLLT